jgi:hypothetical protein
MAHGLQAEPAAAAFVIHAESPSADCSATAVGAERFRDAARAGNDDRAGLAVVGPEEHREGIGFRDQGGKAGIVRQELVPPGRVADAGQAGRQRAALPPGHREPGGLEAAADRQQHVVPGLGDALPEGGWAGGTVADHRAMDVPDQRPRAAAAAVHADEVVGFQDGALPPVAFCWSMEVRTCRGRRVAAWPRLFATPCDARTSHG